MSGMSMSIQDNDGRRPLKWEDVTSDNMNAVVQMALRIAIAAGAFNPIDVQIIFRALELQDMEWKKLKRPVRVNNDRANNEEIEEGLQVQQPGHLDPDAPPLEDVMRVRQLPSV